MDDPAVHTGVRVGHVVDVHRLVVAHVDVHCDACLVVRDVRDGLDAVVDVVHMRVVDNESVDHWVDNDDVEVDTVDAFHCVEVACLALVGTHHMAHSVVVPDSVQLEEYQCDV